METNRARRTAVIVQSELPGRELPGGPQEGLRKAPRACRSGAGCAALYTVPHPGERRSVSVTPERAAMIWSIVKVETVSPRWLSVV